MNVHLKRAAVLMATLALSAAALAADASSLKPPPGAAVALVVFEDLQCPDCARAYPVFWEAARAHKIPVMLHDFPLPRHNWSFKAAVFARFFDTKSQKLGNEYRGYIYKNQPQISNEAGLQQYTQKFADENNVPLPFAVDPDGKLAEKVRTDFSLGQSIGLEHTPTIFVIGRGTGSTPFVEVVDPGKLSAAIEDMQKKAAAATPAKSLPRKTRKKTR